VKRLSVAVALEVVRSGPSASPTIGFAHALDQSPLHPTEIALAQAFSDGLTELGDVELCTRCDERWPLLNVNADGACQRCQNATSRHARMFRSTNYRCGPARLIGRVLTRQVEAWPSLPSCTICLCRRR